MQQTQIVDPLKLYLRQVRELYAYVPSAVIFSYIGSVMCLAVFYDTGDVERGLFWFAFATMVAMIRGGVAWRYHQREKTLSNPDLWAKLMIAGNVLAGIQWGLLGTVMYPDEPGYRDVFSILVITSYIAGGTTPFAAVKWAHFALALPGTLPPTIYIFFIHHGVQWLPGCMALFFMFTVIYFGLKQHDTVINRLRAELQNEALLAQLNAANSRLGMRNDELQHRTEVVKRAQVEARHRAGLFASHVERTLLPVIECDRDFRILEWNQAAATTFGYRNDEAADRNLGELLFPSDRQSQIPVFIEKLFRDNQPTMISMALMTRSGQRLPAYLYVTPIVSEDKTPLRIAVIVTESFTEAGNGSRLKGVKQG